jgi:hypothetical protein
VARVVCCHAERLLWVDIVEKLRLAEFFNNIGHEVPMDRNPLDGRIL